MERADYEASKGTYIRMVPFFFQIMNIEIVKSLTHWLCRMFGHFYGELWKLEEKEIQMIQVVL